MNLITFIEKWGLRRGARLLQKHHATVQAWLKSGSTFQVITNSEGEQEVWQKK